MPTTKKPTRTRRPKRRGRPEHVTKNQLEMVVAAIRPLLKDQQEHHEQTLKSLLNKSQIELPGEERSAEVTDIESEDLTDREKRQRIRDIVQSIGKSYAVLYNDIYDTAVDRHDLKKHPKDKYDPKPSIMVHLNSHELDAALETAYYLQDHKW